jgi:hypothetical protein
MVLWKYLLKYLVLSSEYLVHDLELLMNFLVYKHLYCLCLISI